MNTMKRTLFKIFFNISILAIGVFLTGSGMTQTPEITNPAEKDHPWTSGMNPAALSFQNAQISFGIKAWQYGFLPDEALGLRENHVNFGLPFYLPLGLGIGGDLRYYSAGLYSEVNGSLVLSSRLFDHFSVGVKIGLLGMGFSRNEEFRLVHPNDPLLLNSLWKNSLNAGLGIYWNPGHFTVGMGLDHLNQPDIGLEQTARIPCKISAALSYQYRGFRPTLLLQEDGFALRYGIAVFFQHEQFGQLGFSGTTGLPFKLEARINLSKNGRLQYDVDFAEKAIQSASNGSHELICTYIFDREPDIIEPEIFLSTPELRIFEETVIRSMPRNFSPAQIENEGTVAREYLEPRRRLKNAMVIQTGAPSGIRETRETQLRRYTELGSAIQQTIMQNPDIKIILEADKKTLQDARQLKRFLLANKVLPNQRIRIARLKSAGEARIIGFTPGQELTSRKKTRLSAPDLTLTLDVPGGIRRVKTWHLAIIDQKDGIAKTFSGKSNLPEKLVWNWTNNQGKLVGPGQYTGILTVQGKNGTETQTLSPTFNVILNKRIVKLEFKSAPKQMLSKFDESDM